MAEARVCNREVFVVLEAGHGGAVPELRRALPTTPFRTPPLGDSDSTVFRKPLVW